ncbi:glucagon-like peptide 2 receptor [Callorhinchus milii]|uniref:glucagon-like peptide 2 receptor n=1 Tax=Callorhinchus milii TaxID=7868 RepID=UPI001C3FF518|nr:glucagon-like peptide 2 receptor [Callorhinchus milii]
MSSLCFGWQTVPERSAMRIPSGGEERGAALNQKLQSLKNLRIAGSAFLLLILQTKQVTGSMLEETITNWSLYKEQCLQNLSRSFPKTGIFCNRTFDQFICWPESYPGSVSEPCPWFLPWITSDSTAKAHRYCLENGSWMTLPNSTEIWRNHSECAELNHGLPKKEDERKLLNTLQLIYTVGYSFSLCSLSLAMAILLWLRKLHCTRNYIHMNLFVSFMLRALAVLIKDILLHSTYSKRPDDESGWISFFNVEISNGCKVAQVFMHYFVGANFFWLLVEGIYLHKLIVLAVLSEKNLLKQYILIGWVCPVLFVVPWIITKITSENEGCWGRNVNMWIWWIIRGPVSIAIIMNFYFFLKIMKMLLSKLQAQQMRFGDYKYRLARSTLVLIPLLGIHELVFIFLMDEHVEGLLRHIRLFLQLVISSFQGFLVAVLYCFTNGEVQAELKMRWRCWLMVNHSECGGCLLGKHFKQLGRRPKQRANSNSYLNSSSYYSDTRTSSVQLSVPPGSDLLGHKGIPLDPLPQATQPESSGGFLALGESQL